MAGSRSHDFKGSLDLRGVHTGTVFVTTGTQTTGKAVVTASAGGPVWLHNVTSRTGGKTGAVKVETLDVRTEGSTTVISGSGPIRLTGAVFGISNGGTNTGAVFGIRKGVPTAGGDALNPGLVKIELPPGTDAVQIVAPPEGVELTVDPSLTATFVSADALKTQFGAGGVAG